MWKERFKNRILKILLFQYCLLSCALSQSGVNVLMTKHSFQSLTSRALFYKILIDHFGQMYIATSEGIIIFNGSSEQFVRGSELTGTHRVTTMLEDQNGIVWIGCANGYIYKIINKELLLWKPKYRLPKNKISKMSIDLQNNLWIATKGDGLFHYNGQYLNHFNEEDGLINNDLSDITYIKEKGILVSSDMGIQFLNYDNKINVDKSTSFSCLHDQEIVQDLIVSEDNLFINNLLRGIEMWNYTSDQCVTVWPNKQSELIHNLSFTKDYQLIVTTENIYLKYPKQTEFNRIKINLDLSEIQHIEIDNNNTLWILHRNEGLISVFLPIQKYSINNQVVQSIASDTAGTFLLLCTDSCLQILSIADGQILSTHFYGENLTSIYHKPNENIFWIGTYGKGLIRFDLNSKEFSRYQLSDGLPDLNILHVTGNEHFIWLATLNGILRFDHAHIMHQLSGIKVYNQQNEIPTNFNYQLEPDTSDCLWIATDGNGIYYLERDSDCAERLSHPEGNISIFNMVNNHKGKLFFNASTKGLGYLNFYNNELKWLQFSNKNIEYDCIGLINDSVIIAAGDGVLLQSGSNESICLVMDEEFGVNNFYPSLNAIYRDKNSDIWIGGKNGVLRIKSSILKLHQKPKNSFLSIKILGNEISQYSNDSVFSYSENQFSFEFSAIHFLASDHLDYRYKLIGFDTDWIYSKEGKETYSKLSPGTYRFVFQSSFNGIFDPENEQSFSFTILKPFWTRWWFVSTMVVLLFVFIFTWVKQRERRKIKDQENLRKTSELEFELLKSQVNPHFLFNSFNSVISLIEDDKNRAIDFTEKLSDYFRNILKYRDIQLISLKEELIILMNYMELLALRHPGQILFEKGEMNTNALIAPLTLQLLMENAIKHNEISLEHPLKIKLFCTDHSIIFTNTILRKKSMVQSTGFGLESLKARYQLLTKQLIKIENLSDKFIVEIPLLKY